MKVTTSNIYILAFTFTGIWTRAAEPLRRRESVLELIRTALTYSGHVALVVPIALVEFR